MLQGRCTPLSTSSILIRLIAKEWLWRQQNSIYIPTYHVPPSPCSRTHHLPNHTWSSTKWHIPSAKYQLSLRKSINLSHIDYDESCTFWRHSRVNLNTRNRRPKKKPVTLNTRSITMSHAHFNATRWITYWLRWAMHILTPCAGLEHQIDYDESCPFQRHSLDHILITMSHAHSAAMRWSW
jgi:hypothetical protein